MVAHCDMLATQTLLVVDPTSAKQMAPPQSNLISTAHRFLLAALHVLSRGLVYGCSALSSPFVLTYKCISLAATLQQSISLAEHHLIQKVL